MRSTVFIYTGELGYEILAAHAYVRKYAREHPDEKIGIATRGGADVFYFDCAAFSVDLTDILATSSANCFGCPLSTLQQDEIELRCHRTAEENGCHTRLAYIDRAMRGLCFGSKPSIQIRSEEFLDSLCWPDKTLVGLADLNYDWAPYSGGSFVMLHDRRHGKGWGDKQCDPEAWIDIIEALVEKEKTPVLIGYKPYKKDDAYSVFYEESFYGDNVLNYSAVLEDNINANISLQAFLSFKMEYAIGIWGSATMLPAYFGCKTFALSLERAPIEDLRRDCDLWNKYLSGQLEIVECSCEADSIIDALDRARAI